MEVIHQCRPHSKGEVVSSPVMLTGTHSAKRYTRALKEKSGECKGMSTAVGVKKPHEAQKAKALLKMKAAKDGCW